MKVIFKAVSNDYDLAYYYTKLLASFVFFFLNFKVLERVGSVSDVVLMVKQCEALKHSINENLHVKTLDPSFGLIAPVEAATNSATITSFGGNTVTKNAQGLAGANLNNDPVAVIQNLEY
jgi:hypothetical protein